MLLKLASTIYNKQKVILITGSNRGIGSALLGTFAKCRYNIIAHARKQSADFENELAKLAREYKVTIQPIYFDMTDYSAMKTEIRVLLTKKINIDVLINNAGIAHGGLFQMTMIQSIKEVFDINVFSHMELTQLLLRSMLKNKAGCIINMASVSGIDLKAGNSAYGTSKAVLIAWTKTLAAELGPLGVRVNAIAPGLADTDMAFSMETKAREDMINNSVLKRLIKPDEIANVAVFLASEQASLINGQVIRLDGGSA